MTPRGKHVPRHFRGKVVLSWQISQTKQYKKLTQTTTQIEPSLSRMATEFIRESPANQLKGEVEKGNSDTTTDFLMHLANDNTEQKKNRFHYEAHQRTRRPTTNRIVATDCWWKWLICINNESENWLHKMLAKIMACLDSLHFMAILHCTSAKQNCLSHRLARWNQVRRLYWAFFVEVFRLNFYLSW